MINVKVGDIVKIKDLLIDKAFYTNNFFRVIEYDKYNDRCKLLTIESNITIDKDSKRNMINSFYLRDAKTEYRKKKLKQIENVKSR